MNLSVIATVTAAAALIAAPATVVTAAPVYAIGGGIGPHACRNAAVHYRRDPTYAPPPHCMNTKWFQELAPGDDSPQPGDALPPGDAPPPQP
jgi:hypothetical protein